MKIFVCILALVLGSPIFAQHDSLRLPEDLNQLDASGEKTGTWVEFHEDGVIALLVQFNNGLENGLKLQFDQGGGLIAQEMFNEGELHGMQHYYEFGRLRRVVNYNHGVKDGMEYEYYDINRRLHSETSWVNGEKSGLAKWYFPEGNVSTTYEYRQGSIEGEVIYYFEDGTKRQSTLYKNNQRDGAHYEWHSNGEKKVIGEYRNGVQSGIWLHYDENGKLIRQTEY